MKTKLLLLPFLCLLLIQGCSIFDNEDTLIEIEGEKYPLLDTLQVDNSTVMSRKYKQVGDSVYFEVRKSYEYKDILKPFTYVIITTDSLLEFSKKLLAYRIQNQSDHIDNGCILVLEDLLYGAYSPEEGLRRFLGNVESRFDLSRNCYFVFVGSTNPFEGIPLPYGDGDFEYFPENDNILLGRIPIINLDEGYKYLEKLIKAELFLSASATQVVDDQWQGNKPSPIKFTPYGRKIDSVLDLQNWDRVSIYYEEFAHDTLLEDSLVKGPLDESEKSKVTQAVLSELNEHYGFSIFNMHFSDSLWSDEHIIKENIIDSLTTSSVYFPTAIAYNLTTGKRTLIEKLIVAKHGAVAFVCNSHTMTYMDSHSRFTMSLLSSVSETQTLGEMLQKAKKELGLASYYRYTIVGDPAFSFHNLK